MFQLEAFQKEKQKLYGLVLLAIIITIIVAYVQFFVKNDPQQVVIEEKRVIKTLFTPPQYELIVEDYEKPTRVSQEQFTEVNEKDTISGYEKNENKFLAKSSVFYERWLGLQILIYTYLFIIAVMVMIVLNSEAFDETQKKYQKAHINLRRLLISTCIAVFLSVNLFSGTFINLVNKMNTLSQIEATGTVVQEEKESFRGRYRKSWDYHLWIQYKIDNDETILTKKSVSEATFNKYEEADTIPISYRKNNTFDLFVNTTDSKEYFGILFHRLVWFYFIAVGIVVFAMRRW